MVMENAPDSGEQEPQERLNGGPDAGERIADEPPGDQDPLPNIPPTPLDRQSTGMLDDRPRDVLSEFSARTSAAVMESAEEASGSGLFPQPPRTLADLGLSK